MHIGLQLIAMCWKLLNNRCGCHKRSLSPTIIHPTAGDLLGYTRQWHVLV